MSLNVAVQVVVSAKLQPLLAAQLTSPSTTSYS